MRHPALTLLVACCAIADAHAGTLEASYQKLASEMNATLPTTVDKDTRLDNISVFPGPVFTYNFTIVSANARDINATALRVRGRQQALAGACSQPDTRFVLKEQVTLRYSYRASDGIFLTQFDITPADCGLQR